TPEPPHDQLQEQEGRLRRLLVVGKVRQYPPLLLASEGRVCQDHVHPVLLADLPYVEPEAVLGIDLWRLHAVEEQVHLAEHVRYRLCLPSEDAPLLEYLPILHRFALIFKVQVRLREKPS